MEYVESEKDIGVVIDNKLTFNQHISEKINKANSIMGVLRRTMKYMDCTTFKLLIYSFSKATFRICQPSMVSIYIEAIENVQRRASVTGLVSIENDMIK